jgi:hypothetical protein
LWLYPLALEYSLKRFRKVEMWRVWRKKEDENPSLLPKLAMTHDFLCPMNLRVIKHENSLFLNAKRQIVKILDDSNAIESEFLIGKDVIILSLE